MYRNVFISYRRRDSAAIAGKLSAALKAALAHTHDVFFDTEHIEPGESIPNRIIDALDLAAVMLVVIGPDWVPIARSRFNDDNDFVRFEIEFGLNCRWMNVVPVLVNGAAMPALSDLPEHTQLIGALRDRDAITINDFEREIGSFTSRIKALLGPTTRIADHRDVALLQWDYVDLLRNLILLDLDAVPDIGADEKVKTGEGDRIDGLSSAALSVHPIDPDCVTSAPARQYFEVMQTKPIVPIAATSRGLRYREKVSAEGGTPPYKFRIAEGDLPRGLALDPATGEIAGRCAADGEHRFTVEVADARGAVALRRFSVNGDEGTPEDWAGVFRDYPDTWRLILNDDNDVLGYWHIAPLQADYMERIRKGTFKAGEVTADKLELFQFKGTFDIFFVIVVLADVLQGTVGKNSTPTNALAIRKALRHSFFATLMELAVREVFVRELVADVWTGQGKQFFKHFGLTEVIPCPREDIAALCVGRIETVLGRHARRDYPRLVDRYREQMEGWNEELFAQAAG
jgi:hypothetical protein